MVGSVGSRILDFLVLTRADERALTRIFLKTWPDIRFVPKDYMYTADRSRYRRKDELELRYLDSLDAPGEGWITGWREPGGWTPEWDKFVRRYVDPDSDYVWPDYYVIVNHPEFEFDYIGRPAYWKLPHPGFCDAPENRGRKVRKLRNMEGGRLLVRYKTGNAEQKRFADKVVRLAKKYCSNKLVPMDPIRRMFLRPPSKGGMVWVGPDAMRWVSEKPNRYVDGNFRPADEYDPARLVPEYESTDAQS